MTPAETGWWGAVGNTVTCTVQGAFTDFALIGIWSYQVLLSMFMLLLVTYGWKPSKFEKKIERRLHLPIVVCALLYIVCPVILEGYNPECGHCAPVPLPLVCGNWIYGIGIDCIRGNPTLSYVYWIIFFILLPAVTVFCSGAMFKVYQSVHNQEMRSANYRSFRDDHFRQSKRIRKTMVLYTSSFFICWIFPVICLWVPHGVPALNIIGDILMPLQGMFNMLVFVQPKCLKYQKDHPGTSLLTSYFRVLFKTERCRKTITRLTFYGNLSDEDDGIGFGNYNESSSRPKVIDRRSKDEDTIDRRRKDEDREVDKQFPQKLVKFEEMKKDEDIEMDEMKSTEMEDTTPATSS